MEQTINLANLKRARSWISENVTQAKFHMGTYRSAGDRAVSFTNINDCGTAGCLLGWFPFVPGLEHRESDTYETIALDFEKYCERVTDISHVYNDSLWLFLFGPIWSKYDNSIIGALERLDYVIKYGNRPANWTYRNWIKLSTKEKMNLKPAKS